MLIQTGMTWKSFCYIAVMAFRKNHRVSQHA